MTPNDDKAKRERTIRLLAEQPGVSEEKVRERLANWSDEFAADSLDTIELLIELEEELGDDDR